MTEIEPEATVAVPLTLNLPARVTLPVQVDPASGEYWPSAGLSFSRIFHAPDLLAMGVAVTWRLADGTELSHDAAMALIEQHTAAINAGGTSPDFGVSA